MAPSFPPSIKLNDGHEIPALAYGLGTANYKGSRTEFVPEIVAYTKAAIKVGYTHIDGAQVYGNEEEMGAAIKEAGLPREKLYLTTKLHPQPGVKVEESFAASLRKLGVDYVDLYLVHSPFWDGVNDAQLQDTWAQVEAIQASGRARSIGVSNFLQEHLEAVLKTAKVVPAINQIEYHPYLQHGNLLDFQREHGIAAASYGPLSAIIRAKGGPVDPVYAKLAAKYGVTDGDIALRWVIDQGIVAITTSSSEERLKGYLERLPTFALTKDEIAEISSLGNQKHFRGFWNHIFKDDDRR